jgi:hypothetical protein
MGALRGYGSFTRYKRNGYCTLSSPLFHFGVWCICEQVTYRYLSGLTAKVSGQLRRPSRTRVSRLPAGVT